MRTARYHSSFIGIKPHHTCHVLHILSNAGMNFLLRSSKSSHPAFTFCGIGIGLPREQDWQVLEQHRLARSDGHRLPSVVFFVATTTADKGLAPG